MAANLSPLSIVTLLMSLLLMPACERQHDEQAERIERLTDTPCDLEPGCVVGSGDISVHILIGPGPHALRPFTVNARLPATVPVTELEVQFVMPGMQMGLNRYRLLRQSEGLWSADVTLPVCMSGRSAWVAEFELLADGRRIRFDAPFHLKK